MGVFKEYGLFFLAVAYALFILLMYYEFTCKNIFTDIFALLH